MDVIVFARGTNGCAIISAAEDADLAEIAAAQVPAGSDHVIVDNEALPSVDQAAWRIVNGAVTVDLSALKPQLVAYANAKQWALATGGYTATIAGAAVRFATSETAQVLIAGKAQRFALPNAPASVAWQTGPTDFVTIAAADFVTAATRIADFVQSTFDALQAVLEAVASGAITTTAEIDAAAWPAAHD